MKYYLVALATHGQDTPSFRNVAVVGLSPISWFLAKTMERIYTMINFWEITEGDFSSLSDEVQNAAWDDYNLFHSDEEE